MTDEFERRLRSSFQRAELPMAPAGLRHFLGSVPALERARPTTRPANDFLRIAAVLAAVAFSLGALVVGYNAWWPALDPSPSPSPSPTISPSPSPSPQPTPSPTAGTVPLPAAADLLADRPDATVVLQRSVGPAGEPLSDDETIEDVELERLMLAGDLLFGGACLGPGELSIEIRVPGMPGMEDPFPALVRPCDGHPTVANWAGFDGPFEIQLVAIHVARGASWRVAVGQLPAAAGPGPSFEPFGGREGWWPLWVADGGPVEPEPGLGIAPIIPDDVTALAIYVQCSGETATLSATRVEPTDVEPFETELTCSTGEPFAVELPVTAGEALNVWVKPAESAHIRLITEVDAMPVSTYGPPADLPADLAAVPFAAAGSEYVALGTLAGERQILVPRRGFSPENVAVGDRAALFLNTAEGSHVELVDVSTGELVRVLAEHPAGNFVRNTWLDTPREQVFYTLINQAAERLEVHRVAFDGSGQQRLIANAGGAGLRGATGLVRDRFLADVCNADSCVRSLIDAVTLEATTFTLELEAELCDIVGATDTLVVWRTGFSCQTFGVDDLLVMSIDGSDRRVLPDVGQGSLVNTSQGWLMLYGLSAGSEEYRLLDLETGESRSLGTIPSGFARVTNVRLPADWILFAPWYGIGDFPRSHLLAPVGEAPILLNVVTGERIELPNLPH